MAAVSPFISLRGQSGDAITFYETALGAKCLSKSLYGKDEEGAEGSIRLAVLSIGSTHLRLIDVPDLPDLAPSAATSILLACDSTAGVDTFASALSDKGTPLKRVRFALNRLFAASPLSRTQIKR